jgi:hypothetical protein
LSKVPIRSLGPEILGSGDLGDVLLKVLHAVHDDWEQLDTIPINRTNHPNSKNVGHGDVILEDAHKIHDD